MNDHWKSHGHRGSKSEVGHGQSTVGAAVKDSQFAPGKEK